MKKKCIKIPPKVWRASDQKAVWTDMLKIKKKWIFSVKQIGCFKGFGTDEC